ncbi:MAG: hypothetical protein QM723_05815 [Myxococcaceae bacterium]
MEGSHAGTRHGLLGLGHTFATWPQPTVSLQVSTVHALPSEQVANAPVQAPAWQVPVVHAVAQAVPSGFDELMQERDSMSKVDSTQAVDWQSGGWRASPSSTTLLLPTCSEPM